MRTILIAMKKNTRMLLACTLIIALIWLSSGYQPVNSAALLYRITFIDVGQGDSALLQDPAGFTVLIDGGQTTAGPGLVAYLRSQGLSKIDVVLATHPDSDHIGGLIDVLSMTDIPVLSVVYNGYPGSTQTWTDFAQAVVDEGLSFTVLQYPQKATWGQMQVDALNPDGSLGSPESNAACLAVKVHTGAITTLFACDLDSAQEAVILSRPLDLNADILKVAHHGSDEGSSAAFLSAVTPSIAVISVGQPNAYGHPGAATLARLEDAGAGIWRTDQDGNITIKTDGTTFTVNAPFPGEFSNITYLPVVVREGSLPQPGKVDITNVFYDGSGSNEPDEFVEIQNSGSSSVGLQGWTLRDNSEHIFTFPFFSMQPGQICRVYTNQTNAATCGFSYNSSSAIWNNSGDCAYLRDSAGTEVDRYCY